jgi:hypothetical protein
MITDGDVVHAFADRFDDARALVAGDDGHGVFRRAGDEVPVAVAHAAGGDSDADLAAFRVIEDQVLDAKRLVGGVEHGGADLHQAAK